MFNISSFISTQWSKEQMRVARELDGIVVDLGVPDLPQSHDRLHQIARSVLPEHCGTHRFAFVQGDPGFIVAMVCACYARGVIPVYSKFKTVPLETDASIQLSSVEFDRFAVYPRVVAA